jgi:hypothetical protein
MGADARPRRDDIVKLLNDKGVVYAEVTKDNILKLQAEYEITVLDHARGPEDVGMPPCRGDLIWAIPADLQGQVMFSVVWFDPTGEFARGARRCWKKPPQDPVYQGPTVYIDEKGLWLVDATDGDPHSLV